MIIVNVDNCSPDQQHLYSDQKNFNGTITHINISRTRYALEGSVRVVDLTTGQVLGSHNFEAKPQRDNQSATGIPEFPPVDELKDTALQEVGAQVNAMFFPSANVANLIFYDDKDCGLKQVYEIHKNGDRDGALRMMDSELNQCKSGHKKDKSLARAYYDAGLLHCLHHDYDVASTLFASAMDGKGAEAVASASTSCSAAKAGDAQVKDMRRGWPRFQRHRPSMPEERQTRALLVLPTPQTSRRQKLPPRLQRLLRLPELQL